MNEKESGNKVLGTDFKSLLQDFIQIAFTRRILILLMAALLVCSGIFCAIDRIRYKPLYKASSTFTVYVADPLQSEIRSYNTATAEQMEKTFPYIITSGALGTLVKDKLGISSMPSITASALKGTNIFILDVISRDPQLSYDVLNCVIENYPNISEFVIGPTIMNLLDESGLPHYPTNGFSYKHSIKKGIVAGVILWLAYCVLKVVLRSTVHNEEELKALINAKVFGVLPRVRGGRNAVSCPLPGRSSMASGFSESIRLMRIRAETEMKKANIQILLVSSAISGEGKTTVSLNLGISLAAKNKRVLIIDCDLRNPSVAKNLGVENKNGFADFLQGNLDANDLIHETEFENFYAIYAGGPVNNAAELLADIKAGQFVDACRQYFSYIILDTPPISLLSDASEIAKSADGAMLTVRQNYASKNEILESSQILTESGLPLIGCVANFAETGILNSYNGMYGYKKYYGSYGNHDHSDIDEKKEISEKKESGKKEEISEKTKTVE